MDAGSKHESAGTTPVERTAASFHHVEPGATPETQGSRAREREDAVDEALMMTFPASDPPAWMGVGIATASPSTVDARGSAPPAEPITRANFSRS